jgi:curli biogenesis system outer membrane secretion channel CsgG
MHNNLPPAPALVLQPSELLAVIGVQPESAQRDETDRKNLQNTRIGFGLNNLLAEALFDTGKFRLIEEKEVRKRELIEELVQRYWIERRDTYVEHELRQVAAQLGIELLSYGSISYSRSAGQTLLLGPIGRYTQTLQIAVSVCLYTVPTQTILCREGQGETQQSGTGVIYEFVGNQLDFEKNAVGRATKQAVTAAVRALITAIHFSP